MNSEFSQASNPASNKDSSAGSQIIQPAEDVQQTHSADPASKSVTVFVGGSVGCEPYSPKTWSGILAFLLQAMKGEGILSGAFGIQVHQLRNSFLLAKNFSPHRSVWRKHYYFDPTYRHALTQAAKSIHFDSPVCMQIGAMFSLPEVFPNIICTSYNDGNLPELLKSGYGIEGVSAKRIDQALLYEENVSQQMSAIFTFSEYLRQSFITNYRIPADRVFNIGGAINFSAFPSPASDKDYTKPQLLFIGTEFERKGGILLLDAFRIVRQAIPNAELHIVGPSLINHQLPSGTVCHGHLSKSDPGQKATLESLLREAVLFAMPSLYEPFGIAPLEAMLYQIPCVVTDGWAFRESVTPGFNGELVTKGSVEDLAAKIIHLLSNPDQLAIMGRNGRDRVLAHYTWPAVAKRMASAVRDLRLL